MQQSCILFRGVKMLARNTGRRAWAGLVRSGHYHSSSTLSVKWLGSDGQVVYSPSYENVFDWQKLIDESSEAIKDVKGTGSVANYIPALAKVNVNHFGVAMATVDGSIFTNGEADVPFSMQSISKVFSLILAIRYAHDDLWSRVGREPSGTPFNSLVQLEYEKGVPRNPFINAGAIAVMDILQKYTSPLMLHKSIVDNSYLLGASSAVVQLLRTESGNGGIGVDEVVAASEAETGHRNFSLAHFMASCGKMHNPVNVVLNEYFRQCSIALTCVELAKAGLVLARLGVDASGSQLLSTKEAKRVQAIMMTCGTYDAAGEIAYRIGLPCKSGVGGGVLTIFPRVGAVAVWSPGLDSRGNSVAGVSFLDALVSKSGFSVF